MTQGFYCLIQYCPDFSRAESANVGLLLFRPQPLATAVRIVSDVRPVVKRLAHKTDVATLLGSVQSMARRIEHEHFPSLESLEKFARSRGNQIQLTMPRPMRIDDLATDLDAMFDELVATPEMATAQTKEQAPNLLQQTFETLARRLPDRVFVRPEFHVPSLGIALRPSYAYRNGRLNIVEEMPRGRNVDVLRSGAFALSKEGELVRGLEEGEGRLLVVSNETRRSAKALEREQEFAAMLHKLGHAEFVPGAGIPEFVKQVETELAGH